MPMEIPPSSASRPGGDSLPAGIHNALLFQVFNSISFSLIIGMPVVLYFKYLGASATVLGIVQGLPALLNFLQIPAARFVETVGYRKFVLRGWSVRSLFILLAVGVALLPAQVDAMTRAVLLLFLLFAYNFSRGISACGWLPWITMLVPEKVRGRYISLDQTFGFSAIVAASILAGLYLEGHAGHSGFAVVFLVSFVAALFSLHYLKRIPDVPVPPDAQARSREPVPWRALCGYRPFQKIVAYNCVVLTGWAGGGVVVVPFLRDRFAVTDSQFMYLNAAWGLVYIGVIYALGKWVDRTGSRPLLVHSTFWQVAHFGGWLLIAAGVLPFNLWTVGMQQVTWAFSLAFFALPNTRLLMSTVPEMGRSHFFAIHSVVTSLVAGGTPFLWGLLADTTHGWSARALGIEWHSFSLVYSLVLIVVVTAGLCLRWIEEPKAMAADDFFNEFFVKTPTRAFSRMFARRWMP